MSWMPQAVAASGLSAKSAAAKGQTSLPPSAVLAAFESNLAGPVAMAPTVSAPVSVEPTSSSTGYPATFEIAAALAEKTETILKASLADSTPRALTPPSLSVTPEAIGLSATVGDPAVRRELEVKNAAASGATVNWRAQARVLNGGSWLQVSPESGSVAGSETSALTVEIDYSQIGTTAGIYQGLILVTDTATGFVKTVPVAVVLSTAESRIGLSRSSVLLTIAGGGKAPPAQTVEISNRGTGTLNWSVGNATFNPPAANNWINISPSSGSTGGIYSQPSTLTFSLNDANALSLSSGVYQALVPITAAGASNSPQLLTVTLQRVPGSTPASASLLPGGLVFVARQGGAAPAAKNITLTNRGGGSITAQFNASTSSGGNWLSTNVTGGTTDNGPLTAQVSANPEGLTRGIYRGTITATFSTGESADVKAVLVVTPAPVTARLSYPPAPALDGCTPDSMELIAETIGTGARVPISFPRVLVVSLIDSCGEFVNDATVAANVELSTIPMQAIGDGAYSGTWVPEEQGESVPITFTVLHPTLPPIRQTLQVSTEPAAEGIQLPALGTDGVVEAAGFTSRRPLAPGGFISLFGSRFTTQIAQATKIPLERELAGVRVKIGDIDAPLSFVSPGQINAQLPFEFEPGAEVPILVSSNGVLTAPQSYLVAPATPGIFVDAGTGLPAILDGQSRQVSPQNPARIGDVLQIFATGLGATDPPVGSSDALSTVSDVLTPVSVEIGGTGMPVLYQGLAPGFVGLYQVNILISDAAPTGDSVPIVLIQNGVVSNQELPATIPVAQP